MQIRETRSGRGAAARVAHVSNILLIYSYNKLIGRVLYSMYAVNVNIIRKCILTVIYCLCSTCVKIAIIWLVCAHTILSYWYFFSKIDNTLVNNPLALVLEATNLVDTDCLSKYRLSLLTAFLFVVYINDVDKQIISNILKFADDTKIYHIVQSPRTLRHCSQISTD